MNSVFVGGLSAGVSSPEAIGWAETETGRGQPGPTRTPITKARMEIFSVSRPRPVAGVLPINARLRFLPSLPKNGRRTRLARVISRRSTFFIIASDQDMDALRFALYKFRWPRNPLHHLAGRPMWPSRSTRDCGVVWGVHAGEPPSYEATLRDTELGTIRPPLSRWP